MGQVRDFLSRDPVASVLARVPVETEAPRMTHMVTSDLGPELSAVCHVGANIVPIGFDEAGLDLLARYIVRHGRQANSIVGPADQVLGLWERIARWYPEPRDIRPHQLSMVWSGAGQCVPDPDVRQAHLGEGALVMPASVAMFIEEVGYDPTAYGPGYEHRVHSLVRNGHTFVRMGTQAGYPYVEFKADIGALAGGVAQIQGVWVHPDLRGRGIAAPAMVSVARFAAATIAPTVSLYVNDYNYAAIRSYEKAGFDVVGEYATVML